MIVVIIGHRGTGKSSFLRRLESYYNEDNRKLISVDLDQLIESQEETKITEIFNNRGEKYFRQLEHIYLSKLVDEYIDNSADVFISAGGGLIITDEIKEKVRCWWVQRQTDQSGRIFLDRPRLNNEIGPLLEYQQRYKEREGRYDSYADKIINVTEGFNFPNDAEKKYIFNKITKLNGDLTVFSDDIGQDFFKNRKEWGIRRYELRDDLLTDDEIEQVRQIIPKENVLISLRENNTSPFVHKLLSENYKWDFPLELKDSWQDFKKYNSPSIVSLHETIDGETFEQCLDRFQPWEGKTILKFAPIVENFTDLLIGHLWAMKDTRNRTFLPQSSDGRWSWYRLLMSQTFPLNFFREKTGSSIDQPLLIDWLRFFNSNNYKFAAILGYPVWSSFTPAEHYSFFAKSHIPVLRINLERENWEEGIKVLITLGLKFAAVTSPLKLLAYESCKTKTAEAEQFKSVNTLFINNSNEILGHNTDLEGLRVLLQKHINDDNLVVWGGGGTLPLLKKILKRGQFISARTGKCRDGKELIQNPKTVVWSVGNIEGLQTPSKKWTPDQVIDLNYFDHSPGIEYALSIGAQYKSGSAMFKAQAEKQRTFWMKYDW